LSELIEFINDKRILPKIDSVLSLNEVKDAHDRLESGKQMGKILIKI